jgi:predicted acylesterase/phospholipase RssA
MINDYVIKRPWKDVFSLKIQHILDAYTKKGIFDRSFFEKSLKPLLKAKDLAIDIDLKDFYEYSKIEQHFFTFELNDFQLVDVSYKTHPDLKLIDVLQMSCAIPVLISPVCFDNKCYIDGGVSCNYPLKQCMEQQKNGSEILGFKNVLFEENLEKTIINESSTLLEFIMNFLFKMIFSLSAEGPMTEKPKEIVCHCSFLNIGSMKKAVDSMEERKSLFQKGVESAADFIRG